MGAREMSTEERLMRIEIGIASINGTLVEFKQNNEEEHADLKKQWESMHKKLFIDNGDLSVQTRVDRNSRVSKGIIWIGGVLYIALVTALMARWK